jgi:hypothetical protein
MEACANWFCSTIKSEENPNIEEPNNSSQLSILGTDDEKWNSRRTMVRRVSTKTSHFFVLCFMGHIWI